MPRPQLGERRRTGSARTACPAPPPARSRAARRTGRPGGPARPGRPRSTGPSRPSPRSAGPARPAGCAGSACSSITPASSARPPPRRRRRSPRYLGKTTPRDTAPTWCPARPTRCSPDATLGGASTCTTRSTAPMSMPSSRLDVATTAGSRPDLSSSSTMRALLPRHRAVVRPRHDRRARRPPIPDCPMASAGKRSMRAPPSPGTVSRSTASSVSSTLARRRAR